MRELSIMGEKTKKSLKAPVIGSIIFILRSIEHLIIPLTFVLLPLSYAYTLLLSLHVVQSSTGSYGHGIVAYLRKSMTYDLDLLLWLVPFQYI